MRNQARCSIFGGVIARFAGALVLTFLAATLISATKSPFNEHQKAYYADANTVNFVRPGLVIKITAAEIAQDGTITARFKLTDPRGLGLDRLGVTTPGTVGVSFIAATIPAGQTQYTAYTTRVQASPITGTSAVQASAQNNGVFQQVGDGEYIYTFSIKAPATIDRSATHSIGAYGSRNLSEFDLGTSYDDDVFNFVPDGSAVKVTRDVIKTATCNKCHDQLGLHGGSRRSVELCVMCHTPQTTDPDTGNTVDLKVMVHKIHTGSSLPSVQAGKPYVIIGNAQNAHDYSKFGFPAAPGTSNCLACHEQGKGAAQQDAYLKPSRAACGSCHDNVNFATGENHADLPQVTDNQCGTCHIPQGELEFDVSIHGAHQDPRFSRDLPGTVFELLRVEDVGPGKKPTVTFTLKDKKGNPIKASEMASFSLVLAGPSSDYAGFVSEDVRTALGPGDGTYFWTFNAALPATATGSYTVGIQGYRNITLLPGTKQERVQRDAGGNKVIHFAIDGSKAEPRRQVVSIDKCNACHSSLSLHGNNRNAIEMCVLCHNPNQTDIARRPATALPAESVNFRTMIHRIHTGKDLGYDYTIYGFGNTAISFKEVGFPGDRRNCGACHVNGSEQLPLKTNLLPVIDPRGHVNPAGPTATSCTSCHSSIQAASHALANTTPLAESCSVCHGPNADFSINRVHAR
ncbi:MAG: OmcA/MtrC family decaheme c-type cytochrome [Acidobacteriia bacterium]|nr:OmcA/MtrC family decaheme c-type cytochrome [Terriglobia bacterium]